jgi:hypothetical protein
MTKQQQKPAPSSAPGVMILRADGQDVQEPVLVGGVAAQLILAIASHAEEIGSYAKGQVQLDYGPGGVQGRLHPLWEHTIDPEILAQYVGQPSPVSPRAPRSPARRRSHAPVVIDAEIIRGDETAPWHLQNSPES